ncbi:NAD(P)-binding protein [Nocardia sp. NPDC050630]|uniref:NAD(P)-binding protein n=1 Tax=Nocardia sp. NPDC050630 TaxID=3364321 RepID=UPI0037A2313D
MSEAVIVGGGIGGLAAAVAFLRQGWEVEVLERRPRSLPPAWVCLCGPTRFAPGTRSISAIGYVNVPSRKGRRVSGIARGAR